MSSAAVNSTLSHDLAQIRSVIDNNVLGLACGLAADRTNFKNNAPKCLGITAAQ